MAANSSATGYGSVLGGFEMIWDSVAVFECPVARKCSLLAHSLAPTFLAVAVSALSVPLRWALEKDRVFQVPVTAQVSVSS